MLNSLDSDQAQHFFGPDLGPNCLQRLSADDKKLSYFLNPYPPEPGYMGLIVRKPVLGVSDKVRFKPACSAVETRKKIEISLIASLDMKLSNKRIAKVLIRLHGCAGWSATLLFANPLKTGFLVSQPISSLENTVCLDQLASSGYTLFSFQDDR